MTTLLKFVNRFLRRSTFFLLTYPRISHLFDRNHNAMDTKTAKMLAVLQEKKARAKARHERRMKAGKASINRRWSAPVGGCLRHLPLSSRHGKQDEATVRFISATTTEGMGNQKGRQKHSKKSCVLLPPTNSNLMKMGLICTTIVFAARGVS